MSLPAVSLAALIVALLLSCTSRVNVGIVAAAFAWIVGVFFGRLSVNDVLSGFPASLFLTLAGVTLLFAQAQGNGTLDRVAHQAVRGCRGNTGLIPVMFFVLALALASLGPGNIATAALVAPMAMTTALRAGIPPFLMAIMVGNGANAGSLSPLAPTGVIVNGLMARIGLAGMEWQTYANNLLAHSAVALAGYLLLGGWKLFGRRHQRDGAEQPAPLDAKHALTLAVIAVLVAGVLFGGWNVGLAAFAGASLLALLRAADDAEAIRRMPWGVILMVCGVTVLVALLERTKGLDLFTDLLARLANRSTITGVIAFITGLVSTYSSTSGVVLPAFLPTVPGLVARLGGGDPMSIATSMNVGAHLVDVSPLSTIGALCIASVPAGPQSQRLFNQLMLWGLSMAVVGGLACWLLFR